MRNRTVDMSQTDASSDSAAEAVTDHVDAAAGESERMRRAVALLRWGMDTGAFAGAASALSLVQAVRDLRRGNRERALGKGLLAGLFAVMVVTERAPGLGRGGGERGPAQQPSFDSAYEKDAEAVDMPTDGGVVASAAAETYERLGEAAIDGENNRVPVPQEAFNRALLVQGSEAYWGIRETDDAVLVSGLYDSLREAEGTRYVASSEVGTDSRLLRVPDDVLDHWDDVAGGATTVAGGDGLVFLTAESLAAARQIRVVPAVWEDAVRGDGT